MLRVTLILVAIFECTFPQHVPFIIGGGPSERYGFMVAIKRFGAYKCGGSLVSPTHVLTAKHCTALLDLTKYEMVLGEYDRSVTSHKEQYREVQDIIKHKADDIDAALVVLKEAAILTDDVYLVTLANQLPPVGSEVTAMGWGYIRSGSTRKANKLQSVDIPIANNSLCEAEDFDLKSHEICCGDWSAPSYTNVCEGDSGSPVVYSSKESGQLSQVAFTARGHAGCPQGRRFAAFVSVPAIYDWILNITNKSDLTTVMTTEEPAQTTSHTMNLSTPQQGIDSTAWQNITTEERPTLATHTSWQPPSELSKTQQATTTSPLGLTVHSINTRSKPLVTTTDGSEFTTVMTTEKPIQTTLHAMNLNLTQQEISSTTLENVTNQNMSVLSPQISWQPSTALSKTQHPTMTSPLGLSAHTVTTSSTLQNITTEEQYSTEILPLHRRGKLKTFVVITCVVVGIIFGTIVTLGIVQFCKRLAAWKVQPICNGKYRTDGDVPYDDDRKCRLNGMKQWQTTQTKYNKHGIKQCWDTDMREYNGAISVVLSENCTKQVDFSSVIIHMPNHSCP